MTRISEPHRRQYQGAIRVSGVLVGLAAFDDAGFGLAAGHGPGADGVGDVVQAGRAETEDQSGRDRAVDGGGSPQEIGDGQSDAEQHGDQRGPGAGQTEALAEGLAQWTDDTGPQPVINPQAWKDRAADAIPPAGPVAVGVKFSLDGSRVAASAARKPSGHGPHVEALGEWPLTEGIAVLSTLLSAQWPKLAAIVIDGKAGRDLLVQNLRQARVRELLIITPTVDQVIAANATFLASVEDSTLTHGNQPGLTASVGASTKRPIGTAGGWGWLAIADGDEVPTEAAALAVWGATTTRRNTSAVPSRLSE